MPEVSHMSFRSGGSPNYETALPIRDNNANHHAQGLNCAEVSFDTVRLERLKKKHIPALLDASHAYPADPDKFVAYKCAPAVFRTIAGIQSLFPRQRTLDFHTIFHLNEPVGIVGIAGITETKHAGIWLVPSKRRGGIGAIAGRKALLAAFAKQSKLKKIVAFAARRNDGSIILQEDLGLRPDLKYARFEKRTGFEFRSITRDGAAAAEEAGWTAPPEGRRYQLEQQALRLNLHAAQAKAAAAVAA